MMPTDAYSATRAAQRRFCGEEQRGPIPAAAGVGVDSAVDETPEADVPGSIPPAYETANGQIEMNSRCALCGTALSTRDLPAGNGTRCRECAPRVEPA